ncbi:MAG: DUF1858 domain-containing protein [bacterium]|nr:DUF1858 domain-containing protein [bacterium]
MSERPDITPEMKVGELLDAYPELEEELIAVAPPFEKLRNPVLRRTVAKVTSLRQAAQVGGVGIGELITRLRVAAGLDEPWEEGESASATDRPAWLDTVEVTATRDLRPDIEEGEHPLPVVMAAVRGLVVGQAYVIVTPFVPAPMIDRITGEGVQAWTEQAGPEEFRTTFARAATG